MDRIRALEIGLVVAVLCGASLAAAAFYLSTSTGVSTITSLSQHTAVTTTTSTVSVSVSPSTVRTTVTATTTVITTTTVSTTTTYTCCSVSTERLGFWLQEQDIMEQYSASAFFNAMFLTPPYPSSMEMMIFAILQDETNNNGCSATSPYVSASINYWSQVAQMADSYPNIRLIFEVAFNATSSTYGLSCFNTVVQGLSQYSSVYGIGIEGEYTSGKTASTYSSAMGYVTKAGKLFINYFAPAGYIPAGGYDITHTNFPAQGDQVGTLQDADSQTVGLSSGYYDSFPFPSNFTCPIGPEEVASGPLNNEPQGYNECVVSTELATAASFSPASGRQFLELCPGFSSSGSFTGVSGRSTTQLWDNPTLRNWIWTDPSYLGDFVLSS